MQKKNGQKKSVSAVVFTNSVPILGVGLKMQIFAENTKNRGFSIFEK